jgi:hypothetical protein
MKKAVIVGTTHDIQEGNSQQGDFESYLIELVQKYGVEAIAEEIGEDADFVVAKIVCQQLYIAYKIIDPNPKEYDELGIKPLHHIEGEIMFKHDLGAPPKADNGKPSDALNEFESRKREEHHSIREKEWLKRTLSLDIWPVLVICGSAHVEHFSRLLSNNGIGATIAVSNWSG